MTRKQQSRAYGDGYLAGVRDRAWGWMSEYAWYGLVLDPIGSYSWWYSKGYRLARSQA